MIGILTLLEATLTLPGIAGIILTVGMAVDANVLIFERIKEENLRNSKVFDLAKYLRKKGSNVDIYDPLIDEKIENKNFKFLNCFNLNFSKPTIAIMAALSPQNSLEGKIGLKFIFNETSFKPFLIVSLAATPPATTKYFKDIDLANEIS